MTSIWWVSGVCALYRHSPCPTSRGDSCVRDIPEAPGERSLKPVQSITLQFLASPETLSRAVLLD